MPPKPSKASSLSRGSRKARKKGRSANLKPGIKRLAASVDCKRLSGTAKRYLNEILVNLMMELAATTTRMREHSKLETVKPKHVQAAVQVTFPYNGEMVKHATAEASASVRRYLEAQEASA